MDENIVSARIGREKYVTEVTTSSHHQLLGDEGAALGGKNRGPSPGDFLRAALATCTAITLRMYVDRKQWDVENILVTVSSRMSDGVTTFVRNISFTGDLDTKQRERLEQIANACPVHKALSNPIVIQTAIL
jgi:putative redox protein